MFKKILIICITVFSTVSLSAQDIHFSQFYAAPLHTNPALTGLFQGSFRAAANYRSQYNSITSDNPYRTYGFSYDARFFAFQDDYFAAGINMVADKAGESQFSTIQGNLSLSYIKTLNKGLYSDHYLVAGAQVGMAQRGINYQALRFGTQFDGSGYDPNLSTQENFGRENFMFMDVSVGLMYYMLFNERSFAYGGGAIAHVNRPNMALLDGPSERLYTKFTGQLGLGYELGDRFDILPSLLFHLQGPSFQINTGLNGRYILDEDEASYKALQLGMWMRTSNSIDGAKLDAIIPTARFDFSNFSFGLSYDINVSSLKDATNTAGGVELSLIYTHPDNKRRSPGCPKF